MILPNVTSSIASFFPYLKEIPLLNAFFDDQTKLFTYIFRPQRFFLMSKVITEIQSWEGVITKNHHYGGVEFRVNSKEIAHIHGSGLIDIFFDKKTKDILLAKGQISEHHIFKNTGWGSFYIKKSSDYPIVIDLLRISFLLKK